MNPEKLIECFGDIDEQFIREAAPGKRHSRRKWWALGATAAAALLLLISVPYFLPYDPAVIPSAAHQEPASNPPTENPGPADAPTHVYYHGSTYCDHGQYIYQLPESAELLGETNVVGMVVPDDADDLDANEAGYVYMDPADESLVYFRWKDWDTAIDGPEKIILLYQYIPTHDISASQTHAEYPYCTRLTSMVRAADAIAEAAVIHVEHNVIPESEISRELNDALVSFP